MAKLATAAAAGDELEQVTSAADSTFACPPFRSLAPSLLGTFRAVRLDFY